MKVENQSTYIALELRNAIDLILNSQPSLTAWVSPTKMTYHYPCVSSHFGFVYRYLHVEPRESLLVVIGEVAPGELPEASTVIECDRMSTSGCTYLIFLTMILNICGLLLRA